MQGGWGPPGGAPPGQGGPPPGGYGTPPPGGFGQPGPGYAQQPQYHGYAGPMHGHGPAMPGPYGTTTCPRCNSPHLHRPSFTWWGGLVGPKLLNHTICSSCGFGFNSKTGKSNSQAIGIYIGVCFGLAILLVLLRVALG